MKPVWSIRCLAAVLLAAVGPAVAQIVVGQTAGFTGVASTSVKDITAGAQLYFDAVNARGGVDGQKIVLRSLDDGFDPERAAANARQLIEKDGAVALFLTRGTPQTLAVLPLLRMHRVPLVAPSTGALELHQPVNRYVFNVRTSYQREAENAVVHLHRIGLDRIALLHMDDSFGADVLAGAMRGMSRSGLKPVLQVPLKRQEPDFSGIAQDTVARRVQAVLIAASAQTTADGIRALRAAGSTAQMITLSNNASYGFVQLLGPHATGIVVSQVFPSERAIQYPMVQEAQQMARAAGVTGLSPAMLEGFAAAKVLTEGLRRAGSKPNARSLRDALEGLRRFDLGGLELGYGPDDRSGLDFADLAVIGSDGRFRR